MKSLQFLSFILIAILASSCQKGLFGNPEDSVIAQSTDPDCGYVQNSLGYRVSWKGVKPIYVTIDASVPPEFYDAMIAAADRWNSSAGHLLISVQKPTGAAKSVAQDQTNGIFWLTQWEDDLSMQQAVTTIYFRGAQAYESDVKINSKNFEFYVSTPKSNREIHMESLMVHEFGHLLGLKHLETWPTVMWPSLAGKTERLSLSAQDLEDLKCEY